MENSEILNLPMQPNGAEAATVKDYLKALLRGVLTEEEGFSGKRPFGDSGWKYELFKPLIQTGVVAGSLDSDGCVDEVDRATADGLLVNLVANL